MQETSLKSTEKKLISIFVIWAFVFLIVFEATFIGMRLFLENNFQKSAFISQVNSLTENRPGWNKVRRVWQQPPIGVNSIILDGSGSIIEIRGNLLASDFEEFFEYGKIDEVKIDTLIEHNWTILIRKKMEGMWNGYSMIFFKKAGYVFDDIMRDVVRFLGIDIMLLIPFYFLGGYFVRRTLQPVRENISVMSHFVHDAWHELKTPLAIVSGNLQYLRDSKSIDRSVITESITTIHTMGESIDGLIELANIQKKAENEYITIKKSVENVIAIYQDQIDTKNLAITITIPENKTVQMEKKHFQILFSNLLTNAIRYNILGGTIDIVVRWKTLKIRDTGIGMTEKESNKIFERFYRVDRSGQTPGTGIGLALVERILRLYDWSISVESEKWKGTTFTIVMK